ncbi:hypothetical protein [Amycolatopsis sp. NPDC004079]|uniref:hypothetical protein n=1 Tax=Amycolatopsis sp. NPDC004079 TaxID=3154549 RepID=UPI0033B041AB
MRTRWAELSAARQSEVRKYLENTALGKAIASHANGDLDCAPWLVAVERACRKRSAVSFTDLADYSWRDCHESGMSPQDALAAALQAEGLA